MSLTLRRCVSAVVVVSVAGCGGAPSVEQAGGGQGPRANPSQYAIEHCKLDVALEPATHRIEATATLTVARRNEAAKEPRRSLRLELHRDLGIDSVVHGGANVPFRRLPEAEHQTETETPPESGDKGPPPAVYELDWSPPGNGPGTLVIHYGGRLFQDVKAGEKLGQVHNFEMRAHVGKEGIYLGDDGAWYPRLPGPDEGHPTQESPLTQFELTATEFPGMVLVASGNRDGAKLDAPRGKRTTWRSPFPLQAMALVGGPHDVFQRRVGDVLVSVHLTKDHASLAPDVLEAIDSYLRLYQPLIGRYPYAEFSVVENFFSSGFAFPGFTVLDAAVIGRGRLVLRPGLLDHEMIHNWWGNGVFVSALDGNWCEALTSYCANYMHHVLAGRHEKARAKRRNTCYGLSRLEPVEDRPLASFGRDGGCGRLIGYDKGSMVFAMLAERIGQDTLWRALRRLFNERLGRLTGWDDIRRVLEQESGQSLKAFFDQWVRGSGVPEIVIDEASYDPRARRLTITVLQKGDDIFDVTVPIRLVYDDGIMDEMVVVNRRAHVAVIKSLVAPQFVELDPDFYVMRRVPLDDVMPTISGIGTSKDLLIVQSNEDNNAYATAAALLKGRYEDAQVTSFREVGASELTAEDLEHGHVLLLGKACLTPAAREILKSGPLAFDDACFSVGDRRYEKPTDEVLCCVRNEHDPGGVICYYYGNDATKLKKTRVLVFYGENSLVTFEDGDVAERRDFEKTQRVAVQCGD
ncbi:MAG: hypothetical protein JXQ75_08945 [Phycisphaerae bacterium]|nr:hypothetical protein [Phycisphaerae bacterium]